MGTERERDITEICAHFQIGCARIEFEMENTVNLGNVTIIHDDESTKDGIERTVWRCDDKQAIL